MEVKNPRLHTPIYTLELVVSSTGCHVGVRPCTFLLANDRTAILNPEKVGFGTCEVPLELCFLTEAAAQRYADQCNDAKRRLGFCD